MSSIPPSDQNQPPQNQSTPAGTNQESSLIRRISDVATNVFPTLTSSPTHTTTLDSDLNEKAQFLRDLDKWSENETRLNLNNAKNIKIAKEKIIQCYSNLNFLLHACLFDN